MRTLQVQVTGDWAGLEEMFAAATEGAEEFGSEVTAALDEILAPLGDVQDEIGAFGEKMEATAGASAAALDEVGASAKDLGGLLTEAFEEPEDAEESMATQLKSISDQFFALSSRAKAVGDDVAAAMKEPTDAIKLLGTSADTAATAIDKIGADAKATAGETSTAADDMTGSAGDVAKAWDTATAPIKELGEQLNIVAGDASTLGEKIAGVTEGMSTDIKAVGEQLSLLGDEMAGVAEKTDASGQLSLFGLGAGAGAAAANAGDDVKAAAGEEAAGGEEAAIGGEEAAGGGAAAAEGGSFGELLAGGLMAGIAATFLGPLSESAVKTAEQLQKLHDMTGLPIAELEKLSITTDAAGISLDKLPTMIGRLDKTIGTAEAGGAGQAKQLSQLNINPQAFEKASSSGQAQMILQALQGKNLNSTELEAALKAFGTNTDSFGTTSTSKSGSQTTTYSLGNQSQAEQLAAIEKGLKTSTAAGSAFGRMLEENGIQFDAFAKADFPTQLNMIADAFDRAKTPAQGVALVMAAFGRSGTQMLPLIENLKVLNGLSDRLHMPHLDSKQAEVSAMEMKELDQYLKLVADTIAVKLVPVLATMTEDFISVAGPVVEFIDHSETLKVGLEALAAAFVAFKAEGMIEALVTPLAGLAAGFVALLNLIPGVTLEFEGLDAAMDANPIGMIAAALAALGVVIYEIVEHWSVFSSTVESVLNGVLGFVETWWPELLAPFTGGLSLIVGYFVDHWATIKSDTEADFHDITSFFTGWWDTLGTAFDTGLKTVETKLAGAWSSITSGVSSAWNAISSFLTKWWPELVGALAGPIGILVAYVATHWSQIKQDAVDAFDSLISVISAIPGKIQAIFADAGQWLLAAGKAIIDGLWNGISGEIPGLLSNIASNVVDAVKKIPVIGGLIGSPSPYFTTVGEAITQGLGNGITNNAELATGPIQGLAAMVNQIGAGISTSTAGISSGLSTATQGLNVPTSIASPTGGGPVTLNLNLSGGVFMGTDLQAVAQQLEGPIRSALYRTRRSNVTTELG